MFLITPSQADDIRDFQIEGMSIGDSLLDFVNEDKILKELERNKDDYHWTDGKFGDVYIYEETETNNPTIDCTNYMEKINTLKTDYQDLQRRILREAHPYEFALS